MPEVTRDYDKLYQWLRMHPNGVTKAEIAEQAGADHSSVASVLISLAKNPKHKFFTEKRGGHAYVVAYTEE